MDLTSKKDRQRLYGAIKASREALAPFRKNRKSLIEAYVGSDYGEQDAERRSTLVNMMLMTADTFTMSLAANRPRCDITAMDPALYPFSKTFEKALNSLLQEVRIEKTLRAIVLDAFFSVGIAKVYVAESDDRVEFPNPEYPPEPGAESSADEWDRYRDQQGSVPRSVWYDPGKPFVERISLDDWCHDMSASRWDECRFMVHYYRKSLALVKNNTEYDGIARSLINSDSKFGYGQAEEGEEPASELSHGNDKLDYDELEPMVELMDVYLPYEKKWATLSSKQDDIPPLIVKDWDGPETGPFHILTFSDVPDNTMPVSPAQNLRRLHDLTNSLYTKLARQAKRQKTVTAFRGDGTDAQRVGNASDGGIIGIADPDSVKELRYGGVDQANWAFAQGVDSVYNRSAGNLEGAAGLGPMSSTFGQDKLIHGAISKREAKLQFRVVDFTARICSDLGWILWVDGYRQIPGQRMEQGVEVDATWTPDEREGDYLDYNFEVSPHEMPYKSPSERLETLNQVIQGVFMPLAPYAQQQGGMVDVKELMDIYADQINEPRIKEVVKFLGVQEQESVPLGEAPKPITPPREYIHRNVSSGPPQNHQDVVSRAFARSSDEG